MQFTLLNTRKCQKTGFCDEDGEDGAVHRCIHAIMHLIEDHAKAAEIPIRFAASKVAEGDSRIIELLNLDDNEKHMIDHITYQMEKSVGLISQRQ